MQPSSTPSAESAACFINNPTNKDEYLDLSPLTRENDNWVAIKDASGNSLEYDYHLNICQKLQGGETCGVEGGGDNVLWPSACQKKGEGGATKPMGSSESALQWDLSFTNPENPGDGVKMSFGGGDNNGADSCHSTYSRKVEISFQCGYGLGEPVFNAETDDCLYVTMMIHPLRFFNSQTQDRCTPSASSN